MNYLLVLKKCFSFYDIEEIDLLDALSTILEFLLTNGIS